MVLTGLDSWVVEVDAECGPLLEPMTASGCLLGPAVGVEAEEHGEDGLE